MPKRTNTIRGTLARAIVAEAERRGIDLAREFADAYEASATGAGLTPTRLRFLSAMLRYAETALRTAPVESPRQAPASPPLTQPVHLFYQDKPLIH